MVRFPRHLRQINKNQEGFFTTSKSISSHWLIGNWFPGDFGMEERELDGFDLFDFYFLHILHTLL